MKQLIQIIPLLFCLTSGCYWQFNNPSDSQSSEFTTNSKASLSLISKAPFYQFDTITFYGDISSESVRKTDLVKRYDWDFDNNGSIDTTLSTSGTLRIPVQKSGTFSVGLLLHDALGYTSKDSITIQIVPKFKIDILFPDINVSLDTSCAFYSQNEYTMRPVVLLGRYLTYQNKVESISLGSFVFELLKNLTGTIDYNTLSLPYKKGYDNGVYVLNNGSLTMNAAFLYGTTANGHLENDTIKHDLFDPRSYIQSISYQSAAPYYKLTPGPLWDLTSGFSVDVSNPLNPKVSLHISLQDIKFRGFREVNSRYTMSTQMSDSNQLQHPVMDYILFNYHGLANIQPFFIRDIASLVNSDSLCIDMSGSEIVSDSFPMTFKLQKAIDTTRVTFNFQLTQNIIKQIVRFGTSNGNRKVSGTYSAQSNLTVQTFSMVKSYFLGNYSTTNADTARFYCDLNMTSQFGTLFFDTPEPDHITFVSDRYSYSFTMHQGNIYK